MKIRRVICGISRAPESLEAVRQATRLSPPGAELRLVSVIEPPVVMPSAGFTGTEWSIPQYDPDMYSAIEEATEETLKRAREEASPDRKVETVVITGTPTQGLVDEVEDDATDMIALGVRNESRALGILGGRVATWLVHEAPCAVYLAREAAESARFPRSIVVGVDGSEASLRAFDAAEALAAETGAALRIVIAEHRGVDGADVRSKLAALPELDVVELHNDPVEALVDMAGDITVVGSTGHGGLRRLGSVSERVAHKAPASVLVVR